MPLSFPNVALLGLSQDSRFFDAGFQYSANRRLTVQGVVTDLTNSFGITGIWTGAEGLLATVRNQNNYQDLYLNGVSFGSGKIESITFDPGLDVRTKNYQATITVQDSGNLFNLTGFFYSGIDTSNFRYLNSFSENYSFDRKLNGGYSVSQSASVQFSSGVGQLNAIQAAQSLARTLFTGSNLGFAFYSGYTNKQGKRFFEESYNLIDNSVSFQSTFDFDNNLGNYSATRTNTVDFGEDGIIRTTEQGNIRGIENPNYQRALSALSTELTGSYYRCSGAAKVYLPSGSLLLPYPVSQGRTLDVFNNNLNYEISYDNNPNNSGTYFWDYTQQISRQDGIGTIDENGSIIGRGSNRTLAFAASQNGFTNIRNGIPGRTTALFLSSFGSNVNFLESKREAFSPFQGRVNYDYQYSNDPSLISNSGIRRKEITVDSTSPIYAYNKVNIFNYKEIAQNDYQSTVGQTSIKVNMQGDKTVALSDFLATGQAELTNRAPAGNDRYIDNITYSFDPNNGVAETNLTWIYNLPAVKTIVP